MLRLTHLAAAVVGVAVLTAGTASVQALDNGVFRGLNKSHTAYGMAQFHYMNIIDSDKVAIRLRNPVSTNMAAATLIYTRGTADEDRPTEVYLGCRVDTLTPHAAKVIRDDYLPENIYGNDQRYVEIIAAPFEPVDITSKDGEVRRQSRLANGLGIAVTRRARSAVEDSFPAHPRIFSLPMDLEGVIDPTDPDGERELGTNQREDAFFCICQEVTDLGLDKDVFKAFGIECPFDP